MTFQASTRASYVVSMYLTLTSLAAIDARVCQMISGHFGRETYMPTKVNTIKEQCEICHLPYVVQSCTHSNGLLQATS